ncbi:DUF3302 domain-containing protein [Colwellia psychrerythraea]|uniref:GTPase n=1 Tax=Colwellia psychrerythraea (strain 34H / ATCC BAA-681) TaxID=167879 RepID=Q47ZP1_COLP3|nr:DUF3302 domain-containing protein [Colwellia psychrerythraea]AAZ27102.1 hypothetical protein CPS_3030 [Colwellia psychrerythraea 34H]
MLDYFALFLVFFVILVLFYGIIVVHDIPYEIAVHRQHPHQDAIHVAGWISLFTLGAIWPFLWIWATLYKPGIGWGMVHHTSDSDIKTSKLELDILELQKQVELLANSQIKETKGI